MSNDSNTTNSNEKSKLSLRSSKLTMKSGVIEKGEFEIKQRRRKQQAEDNIAQDDIPEGLTLQEWEERKKALNTALLNKEEQEKKQKELTQTRTQEEEAQKQKIIERQNQQERIGQAKKIKEQQKISQAQESEDLPKKDGEKPPVNVTSEAKETIAEMQKEEDRQKRILRANAEGTLDDNSFTPKRKKRSGEEEDSAKAKKNKPTFGQRRGGRLTVQSVLSLGEDGEKQRSYAALQRQRRKLQQKNKQEESAKIVRDVIIPETISVQDLANRMAVRAGEVVKALVKMGVMASSSQRIDGDTAELIASEFGHNIKRVADSDVEFDLHIPDNDETQLQKRCPVVTVMGHVDHGKTSLLDTIRKTSITSGEAGGITQHIGAYQVELSNGEKITFVDTPGHAAFTAMRARGANVTDIIVLVVAADDGIKEQTVEAISHAQAAKVPIVVAVNKIDKPNINIERVKNELLIHNLVLESHGGDILSVEVSAKQGIGIDKLEETLLLQAEMLELKAAYNRSAEGVIIESKIDKGRGCLATVLVKKGTLNIGDIFVSGKEFGRVRALITDSGQHVKQALPGQPIEVIGYNGLPVAGDDFIVVEQEAKAREISEFRTQREHKKQMVAKRKTMDSLFADVSSGEQKQCRELVVLLKSDTQGSAEAIRNSLAKLANDEVSVKIIHSGIGGINESDVVLADAASAVIFGFNVRASVKAKTALDNAAIDVRYYSVIYDLIDDIKVVLSGMMAPEIRETFIGNAQVRQVFNVSKIGRIAGCYVTDGAVRSGAKVRIIRDSVVIHEGNLSTLKREKNEVKEVNSGYECGMSFESYQDVKEGDVIEFFEVATIQRQWQPSGG